MKHRFQGSAQAKNGLGINIYLAKAFSLLLGKPTGAIGAMKHLLAGCRLCKGPPCWRSPRGLWELLLPLLCSLLTSPGSALATHTFPELPHPQPHSFFALLNLLWFLFLRMAHNPTQFANRPSVALSTSHFKRTIS